MTSLRPVLVGYNLVRSGPCACLSFICIQNLLVAHAFAAVGLHSLPSVLDHFLVSISFMACPIRGWALLDGGFCFSFSLPFFLLLSLAIPFHRSCCKVVLLQTGWASLGLLFILPLMAQQGHWFLCYIVSGLPCPICFPLSFLGHFPIFALTWAFTEFFELPWPNYIISHPWGSWACHQPLTFFTFITLGLPQPILTFPHHILPMVCFFFFFPLFSGSIMPIYLFNTHLFISWAYNPLFLPLRFNGFSICLPTPFCPWCWASSSHLGFQNGPQQR